MTKPSKEAAYNTTAAPRVADATSSRVRLINSDRVGVNGEKNPAMKHASITTPDVRLPLLAKDIEAILPHRYPFLFIDQVIEFTDGDGIVGIKSVSMGEPYFQGHFPGNPIMPGVIILEALAQLGAIYAKVCSAGVPPETLIVFSGAEEVRFRKPVYPGDVLRLEMNVLRVKFGHWKMEGRAFVGGERVADGILTATELRRDGK